MKKYILFFVLLFVFSCTAVKADMYNSVLTQDIRDNIDNSFSDLNIDIDALTLIDKLNNGDFETGIEKYLLKAKNHIVNEFKDIFSDIAVIIALILINSLIMKLYYDKKRADAVRLVCVAVVLLNLLKILLGITDMVIGLTDTLALFINSFIPILLSITAGAGQAVSAGILNPVILVASSIATLIIKSVIIPFTMITLALKLSNSVTGKDNLLMLGNQLNSLIKWIIGLMVTIYTGIVSLTGSIATSIDEVTIKTAKYAVGTFIPYVGSMLSDSVELILNCSSVVKNSVGIVGALSILSVVALPCVQLVIKIFLFKLLSVLVSAVSEKPIVDCLESISSCLSIMLGLVLASSLMYILSITVIIHIGGA